MSSQRVMLTFTDEEMKRIEKCANDAGFTAIATFIKVVFMKEMMRKESVNEKV